MRIRRPGRARREAERSIARGGELAADLPRLDHAEVHARAEEIVRTGEDLIDLVERGEEASRARALDALEILTAAVVARRDRTGGPGGNPAVFAARRLAAVLYALRDRLAEGLARDLGLPLDDRPRHARLRGLLGTARRNAERPIVVRVATGRALARIPWWRTLWIVQLDPTCPPRPVAETSSEQEDLDLEHADVLQEHAERYLEHHSDDLHVVLLREDELGHYHTAEQVFGPFEAGEALAWVAGCRWQPDGEVPAAVRERAEKVLPYRLSALIERRHGLAGGERGRQVPRGAG